MLKWLQGIISRGKATASIPCSPGNESSVPRLHDDDQDEVRETTSLPKACQGMHDPLRIEIHSDTLLPARVTGIDSIKVRRKHVRNKVSTPASQNVQNDSRHVECSLTSSATSDPKHRQPTVPGTQLTTATTVQLLPASLSDTQSISGTPHAHCKPPLMRDTWQAATPDVSLTSLPATHQSTSLDVQLAALDTHIAPQTIIDTEVSATPLDTHLITAASILQISTKSDTHFTATSSPGTHPTAVATPLDIHLTATSVPDSHITAAVTPDTHLTATLETHLKAATLDTRLTAQATPDTHFTATTPDTHPTGTTIPETHLTAASTPDTHPTAAETPDTLLRIATTPNTHLTASATPDTHLFAETTPDTHLFAETTPDTHLFAETTDSRLTATTIPDTQPTALTTPDAHLTAVSTYKTHLGVILTPDTQLQAAVIPDTQLTAIAKPDTHRSTVTTPDVHLTATTAVTKTATDLHLRKAIAPDTLLTAAAASPDTRLKVTISPDRHLTATPTPDTHTIARTTDTHLTATTVSDTHLIATTTPDFTAAVTPDTHLTATATPDTHHTATATLDTCLTATATPDTHLTATATPDTYLRATATPDLTASLTPDIQPIAVATPNTHLTAATTPDTHLTSTATPDTHLTATATQDTHLTVTPTPDTHLTATPSPDTYLTAPPTPDTHITSPPTPDTHLIATPTPDTYLTMTATPDTYLTAAASPDTHLTVTTTADTLLRAATTLETHLTSLATLDTPLTATSDTHFTVAATPYTHLTAATIPDTHLTMSTANTHLTAATTPDTRITAEATRDTHIIAAATPDAHLTTTTAPDTLLTATATPDSQITTTAASDTHDIAATTPDTHLTVVTTRDTHLTTATADIHCTAVTTPDTHITGAAADPDTLLMVVTTPNTHLTAVTTPDTQHIQAPDLQLPAIAQVSQLTTETQPVERGSSSPPKGIGQKKSVFESSIMESEQIRVACKNGNMAVVDGQSFISCQSPYPCCHVSLCLYGQQGTLATILGERYILTLLEGASVPVCISLQASEDQISVCRVLWQGEKAIPLSQVLDGTQVEFDAICSPSTGTLVAVIIWQDTKPTVCVQPAAKESYVMIRGKGFCCGLDEVDEITESIIVNFDDHLVCAEVSRDVVYMNGRKSHVWELRQHGLDPIFATVFQLLKGDVAGSVTYVCTCLWTGQMPEISKLPMLLKHRQAYVKKSHGLYVKSNDTFILYCDVDSALTTSEKAYKLTFIVDGVKKSLLITRDQLYAEEKGQIASITSKMHLKAHISCCSSKDGQILWTVLMGKLPSTSSCSTGYTGSQANAHMNITLDYRHVETGKEDIRECLLNPGLKGPQNEYAKEVCPASQSESATNTTSTSSLTGQVRQRTSNIGSLSDQGGLKTGETCRSSDHARLETIINCSIIASQPKLENLTCSVAKAGTDMAILSATGKFIIVTKDDFFINTEKLLASVSLQTELKQFPNVDTVSYENNDPIKISGYLIKHTAVVAWAGKKPTNIDEIVKAWECKFFQTLNNENEVLYSKTLKDSSHNDKVFEAAGGLIDVFCDTGILLLHSKHIEGGTGDAIVCLSCIYKDGFPVDRSQLRSIPAGQMWHCLVQQRPQHEVKDDDPKYRVNLAWQGQKPHAFCYSSLKDRKTKLHQSSSDDTLSSHMKSFSCSLTDQMRPQTSSPSSLTDQVRPQTISTSNFTELRRLHTKSTDSLTVKGRPQISNTSCLTDHLRSVFSSTNSFSDQTKSVSKKTKSVSKKNNSCMDQTQLQTNINHKSVVSQSKLEYLTCTVAEAGTDIAILSAVGKFILVSRDDFFINKKKLKDSANLKNELKGFPNVGTMLYETEYPTEKLGFVINHAAVVAWAGKKPPDVDEIVKTWESKTFKTSHNKNEASSSKILKDSLSLNDDRFQASGVLKNVHPVTGTLMLHSKHIEGGTGEATVHLSCMYKDGLPVKKKQLKSIPISCMWNCLAQKRPPHNVKNGEPKYWVILAWQGKKPSASYYSSLKDRKTQLCQPRSDCSLSSHMQLLSTSTSSLTGQGRTQTSSASSLTDLVRPKTRSTNSLTGQRRPQTSSTSSLTGQVRPKTSSTSSLTGLGRPQTSSTSSLTGLVRPETSSTNSLTGQVRPQTSSTSILTGLVRPQTSSFNSLAGQGRPQTSSTNSLTGQGRPQTSSTNSLAGQERPQTSSTSSLGDYCKLEITEAKRKRRKKKKTTGASSLTDEFASEKKCDAFSKGHITEIHRTIGQLETDNGTVLYFSRDCCFLYGLCLHHVELWHVLTLGVKVELELSKDGTRVKGVWVGSRPHQQPKLLIPMVTTWCHYNSVPEAATQILLREAESFSSRFFPTASCNSEEEVIDITYASC